MKIERTIDRESKLKLYVQIYSILREKIENGEWPAGRQIPTEDELCRTYDVSKVTVREAIQELVREGYLRRQQGKGTFVLIPAPQIGLTVRSRLADIPYGEEVTVRKEILESRSLTPSSDIRLLLQTEEEIHYVLFKKYIDGHPSFIEELFFPALIILAMDEDDILYKSFVDVIEEKGTKKISRVIQICELETLKDEMSSHLGVSGGCQALVVKRIFFSADGVPLAYSRSALGAGNKVRMEFERVK